MGKSASVTVSPPNAPLCPWIHRICRMDSWDMSYGKMKLDSGTFNDDFHTFGLYWDETHMVRRRRCRWRLTVVNRTAPCGRSYACTEIVVSVSVKTIPTPNRAHEQADIHEQTPITYNLTYNAAAWRPRKRYYTAVLATPPPPPACFLLLFCCSTRM